MSLPHGNALTWAVVDNLTLPEQYSRLIVLIVINKVVLDTGTCSSRKRKSSDAGYRRLPQPSMSLEFRLTKQNYLVLSDG